MQHFQKTIKSKLSFEGIGLHSGLPVKISLYPEKIDTGIYFLFKKKKIKANWTKAISSQLCTKLASGNLIISTCEHLMSALNGLGVTNLCIEINESELPILDGSSKEFYESILKVGTLVQKKFKKIIKIKKEIKYSIGKKFISIKPNKYDHLEIDYTIDYNDQLIKKQNLNYIHNELNYKNIYQARTFCLHEDLEKIFSLGLAKGGSLDNAIVVSGKKILNQGGLRYKNEFVKHKILDCIGDLYLAGFDLIGKIVTYQGSHELNIMLLKEIFKSDNNFTIINDF